jgi:general secretion pathway protein M
MSALDDLRQRWQALQARERRLVAIAAAVVGLALFWQLAWAPAWAVWRAAPAQRVQVQRQLQQMQALQAQAQALQSQPAMQPEAARHAVQEALKPLGAVARLTDLPDRATVMLRGADAAALARLLTTVRDNAHLTPSMARLQRGADGLWEGQLVFVWPTPAP